jgi:hypothetical protein
MDACREFVTTWELRRSCSNLTLSKILGNSCKEGPIQQKNNPENNYLHLLCTEVRDLRFGVKEVVYLLNRFQSNRTRLQRFWLEQREFCAAMCSCMRGLHAETIFPPLVVPRMLDGRLINLWASCACVSSSPYGIAAAGVCWRCRQASGGRACGGRRTQHRVALDEVAMLMRAVCSWALRLAAAVTPSSSGWQRLTA